MNLKELSNMYTILNTFEGRTQTNLLTEGVLATEKGSSNFHILDRSGE